MGNTLSNQNKATKENNAAVAQARGALGDAYSRIQAQYLPYGVSLDALEGPEFTGYQQQLLDSLGTGYKKANESIAPQLQGETQPLVEQYLKDLLPAARSAAIDAGAYGGSRDMLTKERLLENLNQNITNAAAQDIANQRAQYPSLVGADANQLAQTLSALTAKTDLQNQYSDYLYNAALNYSNALQGAGTTQAKNSGLDLLMNMLNTGANVASAVAQFA